MRKYIAGATTTGKKILRNTVGIAAVLCAVAVPGYSATATGTIDFSGTAGSGAEIVGSTTAGGSLTSFSVPFTQLFIAGAGDAADDGHWTLTSTALTLGAGNVFTLTGTIGTCADCSGTTNLGGGAFTNVVLETFTLSSMLETTATPIPATTSAYNVTGGTSFTMQFGAPTSLTDSASLLAALGETGGTTTPATAGALGSINGTGTTSSNVFTGHSTSAFDNTTVTYTVAATPEPVSFILLGTGLLAIGLISRRRSTAAART